MEPKSQSTTQSGNSPHSQDSLGRGFRKPTRANPFASDFRQEVALTNYYCFTKISQRAFSPDSPKTETLHKYHVQFTPEVADTAFDLRRQLLKLARPAIMGQMGNSHFLFKNTVLLSTFLKVDPMMCEVELDDAHYKIEIKWVAQIQSDDMNQRIFFKAYFDKLARGVKFTQIGNKYYDMQHIINLQQHGLSLMSGFQAIVGMFDSGTFLKIDVSHRVFSNVSLLHEMLDIRNSSNDFQRDCEDRFLNKIVMTMYNHKCHKISRFEWGLTPAMTFTRRLMPGERALQPSEISIAEYMNKRYNIQHVDQYQPLVVSVDEKTQKESYLLPEFCALTGLTDENRANHNLMKELANYNNMNAKTRVEAVQNFLSTIRERCGETMKYWQLQIDEHPYEVQCSVMHPGMLCMQNSQIDLSAVQLRDLDRKLQSEMLSQPELKRWCFVYSGRDQEHLKVLERELIQAAQNYNYPVQKPCYFQVQRPGFKDWANVLTDALTGHDVQMVVLLLPGKMKKAQHYDEIKALLNEHIGTPSQVVLVDTIRRGKNIKSIVSKILVQICAKVGGCPWSYSKMPFMQEPTMVCGLDLFHKKGKTSMLAFVATVDRHFSCYVSKTKPMGQMQQEAVDSLTAIMEWALNQFQARNGFFPKNVVLYRDGVSDSQHETVADNEIQQVEQALGKFQDIKFVYIAVNKRIQTRLFSLSQKGPDAPKQGLVVDSGIVKHQPTNAEKREFFIVSQAAIRGVAQPTHYVVLRSTVQETLQEIELFTYRMCFLYYNVTGAISEPAPIRYAHRLSNVVGDAPAPYTPMDKLRYLYFI